MIKALVCPYCGCSLVRLGISKEKATAHSYDGKEYHFCCQGCADLFDTDPQKYLQSISDVIVCPSCLAEKPLERAFVMKHAGKEVHYCGCPHCAEVFQKSPEHYIKRLEDTIPGGG